MKRLAFAFILIALLSGSAVAGGLTFGITGGINLANVAGDSVEMNETKLCFGGGGFVEFPVAPLISVQPQLLYMMKGMKWGGDTDSGVRLSYIEIPVLVKVNIPMAGPFNPNLFVGPYLGLNTGAEAYIEGVDEDIKDQIKSTDYGLVLGGGFDYALATGKLTFDARYSMGLTSIDDTDDDDDVKNTGIMFMVGYGFSL